MNRKQEEPKNFVNYEQGCQRYYMGENKLRDIARAAGAFYKIGRSVLIDTIALDKYLDLYYKEEI